MFKNLRNIWTARNFFINLKLSGQEPVIIKNFSLNGGDINYGYI